MTNKDTFVNYSQALGQIDDAGTVPTANGGRFYKYGWACSSSENKDGSWTVALGLTVPRFSGKLGEFLSPLFTRKIRFLFRGQRGSKKHSYEITLGDIDVVTGSVRKTDYFLRTDDFSKIITIMRSKIIGR